MDEPPWDPEKARLNFAKHGVTFQEARQVLVHPLTRRWPDIEHSRAEERTIAIGLRAGGGVLTVVTTLDRDGSIRIVSARRATKRERHAYEEP